MGLRKIIKLFDDGNVIVTGLRGRGKDMLFANVIERRKKPYVSNMDYQCRSVDSVYNPLDHSDIDCGKNTYKNFQSGDVNYYEFPYIDGTDVYISDAGIYYPAQFCNELNRDTPYMATFQALSRHLADANFHCNVQNLNRLWDKIREQSDTYIRCCWCKVFFGFVIQKVITYDKYESCLARVEPFRIPPRAFNTKDGKNLRDIEKARYTQIYGHVVGHILIYRNRTNYNTRVFRDKLKGGKRH